MKNTDLHVKILLLKCITKDISFTKISVKLQYLYLVQHMVHQIKAPQFYTDLGLKNSVESS